MPFFALTISQVAGNHLVRLKGESSKIVPTLVLNCFLQPLQFQTRRDSTYLPISFEPHRGHSTPLGQRSAVMNSWHVLSSAKKRVASINPWGKFFSSMPSIYHQFLRSL